MIVEEMRPEDWPAVARIYEEGLDLGTFEDTVPSWDEWAPSHPHRIVARDPDVVGWASLGPVSQRACYRGVLENSVYVAASARGRGIGRALLEELCRRADTAGVWTIQAVMFADNDASRALHEACGFKLVGRRERIAQKHGAWRDTLLLDRRA
ncbi:MAG TPA: GNAT family N-acetyltransferase [Gaiellaceae bacterium]|nr:GNAT family N-acetyltransferase [Gaiellaceae bacterium]